MSKRVHIQLNTSAPRLAGNIGLANAAGFFDGEGCIHIARQLHPGSRRGYIYRLVVTLSQNHLVSLIDFQELVGVAGRLYHRGRQGTTNRDWYTLNFDGKSAEAVLDALLPYLLRKRQEADAALHFQRHCHINTHFGPKGCPAEIWAKRDALYRKLRSLK
jgi:hypothetical protein